MGGCVGLHLTRIFFFILPYSERQNGRIDLHIKYSLNLLSYFIIQKNLKP